MNYIYIIISLAFNELSLPMVQSPLRSIRVWNEVDYYVPSPGDAYENEVDFVPFACDACGTKFNIIDLRICEFSDKILTYVLYLHTTFTYYSPFGLLKV